MISRNSNLTNEAGQTRVSQKNHRVRCFTTHSGWVWAQSHAPVDSITADNPVKALWDSGIQDVATARFSRGWMVPVENQGNPCNERGALKTLMAKESEWHSSTANLGAHCISPRIVQQERPRSIWLKPRHRQRREGIKGYPVGKVVRKGSEKHPICAIVMVSMKPLSQSWDFPIVRSWLTIPPLASVRVHPPCRCPGCSSKVLSRVCLTKSRWSCFETQLKGLASGKKDSLAE